MKGIINIPKDLQSIAGKAELILNFDIDSSFIALQAYAEGIQGISIEQYIEEVIEDDARSCHRFHDTPEYYEALDEKNKDYYEQPELV